VRVNILMVGSGKGSFAMRGLQLGAVMGARVTTQPEAHDWRWADVVVLIKHAARAWAHETAHLSVPVIWDVLDFWRQPEDNDRAVTDLVLQLREIQAAAGVDRLIGATQAMAQHIGGVYVTHHCRTGLTPTAPRQSAAVVGYDGQKKYLGSWLPALQAACAELGLTFVVNPEDLSTVDALVSFRDGRWDGDVCREWKSGVKHVNAIVAGRPMLCQWSSAYAELEPEGAVVATQSGLVEGLRRVASREVREAAYQRGLNVAQGFTVQAVAGRYRTLLGELVRRAA
jgi:hypothetical protein